MVGASVAFRSGNAVAKYIQSGKAGIAQTNLGKGRVCSFGFEYGRVLSAHDADCSFINTANARCIPSCCSPRHR